jgi:uncharacterized protein
MTQGYQVTFFTHQNHKHNGKQINDWMMDLVQTLGLNGIVVHMGGESFIRGGRMHSAHFFDVSDQPIEILIAASTEEIALLFEKLKEEDIHLFYVMQTVEFGMLGES